MAIAAIIDFEGGSAEQDDAVAQEMGVTGQPALAALGLIHYAADATESGCCRPRRRSVASRGRRSRSHRSTPANGSARSDAPRHGRTDVFGLRTNSQGTLLAFAPWFQRPHRSTCPRQSASRSVQFRTTGLGV